jgi:hypothetical protein
MSAATPNASVESTDLGDRLLALADRGTDARCDVLRAFRDAADGATVTLRQLVATELETEISVPRAITLAREVQARW